MDQKSEDAEQKAYWAEMDFLKKERFIENYFLIHGHHPDVPCSINCTPEG